MSQSDESAPVVAEVRRAGLDLEAIQERLLVALDDGPPSAKRWKFLHEDGRALIAEVSRLRAERDEITGTPERWMRWCDHRVLERAEQAEADLATLRARLRDSLRLAKEATNGWACYAKRKIELDEIARLHQEIDELAALLPPPTET